jgi:hypothetical protein
MYLKKKKIQFPNVLVIYTLAIVIKFPNVLVIYTLEIGTLFLTFYS